jgi:hypothetical protein
LKTLAKNAFSEIQPHALLNHSIGLKMTPPSSSGAIESTQGHLLGDSSRLKTFLKSTPKRKQSAFLPPGKKRLRGRILRENG